jgi:hypothetical protein
MWLSPPLSAGERDTTPKNEMILRYGPALRALAPAHGSLVLGTQDEFWRQVFACRRLWSDMRFTADGVHPDAAGHRLLAEVMLHDLGVPEPDGKYPASLSYLPPDQSQRLTPGGVAFSYDIPTTDTDKTNQTRFPWRLNLTNLTDLPVQVSLALTLPEGLKVVAGAPPAQVQLAAGAHQDYEVQVAGPLTAETTVCQAQATWQRDGAPYQAQVQAQLRAPWLVLVPLRGDPFTVTTQPKWSVSPSPAEFKPEPPVLDLAAALPDPVTGQATRWRKYVNHSPWVNTASQDGIDFYNLDDCLHGAVALGVRWVHAPQAIDAHLVLHNGDWTAWCAYEVWVNGAQVYQGILTEEKDKMVDKPVHLNAGWNQVVFKSALWQWLWHAIIELRDADGKPLPGLTYSVEPPAPQ